MSCSGTEHSTDVNCDCAGCNDFTVPNQAVDVSESNKTHRHESKEKKPDDPKIIIPGKFSLIGMQSSHGYLCAL